MVGSDGRRHAHEDHDRAHDARHVEDGGGEPASEHGCPSNRIPSLGGLLEGRRAEPPAWLGWVGDDRRAQSRATMYLAAMAPATGVLGLRGGTAVLDQLPDGRRAADDLRSVGRVVGASQCAAAGEAWGEYRGIPARVRHHGHDQRRVQVELDRLAYPD